MGIDTHQCNHREIESMPAYMSTTQEKSMKHSRASRQIVVVLVALAVFLAQALPMAASHNGGGGEWIVICSGEGAKLIQLDDQDTDAGECTHCSLCLISSNKIQINLASNLTTLIPSEFTNAFYGRAQTTSLSIPEHYWSACRGPPILSIDNIMTTPFSLLTKQQFRAVSNAWRVPCL